MAAIWLWIQADRSSAKAAAPVSARAVGAIASISPRARSKRSVMRRARPLTFMRTGTPATSIWSPSARRLEENKATDQPRFQNTPLRAT